MSVILFHFEELGVEYFCRNLVTTAEHLKNNKGGVEEGNRVTFKCKAATQHLNEAGNPLVMKMTGTQQWEAGTPQIWRCSTLLTAAVGIFEETFSALQLESF